MDVLVQAWLSITAILSGGGCEHPACDDNGICGEEYQLRILGKFPQKFFII